MKTRRLLAVSLGHMAIDILNASVAMILTALAVPFGLNNAQIGFGVMAYQLVGALSQPLFGWLADRLAGRWLGAAGLAWTAGCYLAATYATSYPTLLLWMSLAALGSGAFHPQGAMNASDAGQARRASSATAFFFLLGQMGLALGPMIAGVLLAHSGLPGVRILALATLPMVVLMALELREPASRAPQRRGSSRLAQRPGNGPALTVMVAFGMVVALRATVQQGYYGLLPKFFADQGFTSDQYGFLVGVFSVALALGTLAGGFLGDRFPHRRLLWVTSLATAPFTWGMLLVHGPAYGLLAAAGGFLVGVPHSILVVMAQKLLPERQGLASGAVLGFMFASGALGTGLAGWTADLVGLPRVMYTLGLLPLGVALCTLALPGEPSPSSPEMAPSPSG